MRASARQRLAGSQAAVWIAAGVVLAVALRAPWFGAALGRDEGGDTLIALAWDDVGPFAYGQYFLDRPPLLLALHRLAAEAAGPAGIRVLGVLAAAATVMISTALAVRVVGRRAAGVAALSSAAVVSSVAIGAVYTPSELLAVVPSAASVLALVTALDGPRRRYALFAAAGLLAVTALMIKQSFGDALLAGLAGLVVSVTVLGISRRELLARAGAYAAGVSCGLVGLVIWQHFAQISPHSIYYTLFGFRLDAAAAVTSGDLTAKLSRLALPALGSGLLVGVVCAAVGLWRLRERPAITAVLTTWMVGAAIGIVLGGSFWSHYLIALIPVTVVGASAALVPVRRTRALLLVALVAPAVVVTIASAVGGQPARHQQPELAVADYLRDRANRGDTAYVLYARTNVLYYSGLQSPFPYDWVLMVRAIRGAPDRLRSLLDSSQRPTWIVQWHLPGSFGLDPAGATRRLLAAHYRHAATVCHRPVLLARSVSRPHLNPETRGCATDLSPL